MPSDRLPTAGDAARAGRTHIEVACKHWPRHGRYAIARLDPDQPLLHWLVAISADCPRRRDSADIYRRCGAHMVDLPRG